MFGEGLTKAEGVWREGLSTGVEQATRLGLAEGVLSLVISSGFADQWFSTIVVHFCFLKLRRLFSHRKAMSSSSFIKISTVASKTIDEVIF
jgi:hypothetical protein